MKLAPDIEQWFVDEFTNNKNEWIFTHGERGPDRKHYTKGHFGARNINTGVTIAYSINRKQFNLYDNVNNCPCSDEIESKRVLRALKKAVRTYNKKVWRELEAQKIRSHEAAMDCIRRSTFGEEE